MSSSGPAASRGSPSPAVRLAAGFRALEPRAYRSTGGRNLKLDLHVPAVVPSVLGTPPVLSVHGDRDPVVPFSQSERLHQALDRAGVPNRLHVVAGGGHGDWDAETWGRAYDAVFAFVEGRRAVGERPA